MQSAFKNCVSIVWWTPVKLLTSTSRIPASLWSYQYTFYEIFKQRQFRFSSELRVLLFVKLPPLLWIRAVPLLLTLIMVSRIPLSALYKYHPGWSPNRLHYAYCRSRCRSRRNTAKWVFEDSTKTAYQAAGASEPTWAWAVSFVINHSRYWKQFVYDSSIIFYK